jgi:glutathione synthase/RimK-type ligase-like ATP-grasp enzyme
VSAVTTVGVGCSIAGAPIRVVPVDMDAHDWLVHTRELDALIWDPQVMGPATAAFYKERVYFLEHYRGIRVMPSYRTVWHYESKVAQSYFFEDMGLMRPRTVASFDYHDALACGSDLG